MGGLLLRLRTWWETADRTQKAVTLFGGVFLGILLLGTFYFASKPRLQPAFTGLSYADLGTVEDEAKKLGIAYEITGDGIICVPADKIPELKARLAMDNKLPSSGTANDSLGQPSAFEPRSLQEERQRVRLENDIASTVKCFDGVESVKIKIAPESDSPFAEEKRPATAGVTILEKAGVSLSGEPAKAIANFVAYSTPGLDVNHVTIANQQGKMLWEGGNQDTTGGMADKKIAAEIAESKRREHDLQNMLDQAFGAGTTIAKVSVSLDFDYKRKDVQVPTTSESPATEQHSSEIMTGTRPPLASGSDGQRGNMGPATPPTTSGASTYNNEQVTREYPQGTTETVEQPSPGSLLGMNVTVMADSSKLQDQDQQNSLTQIVGDFIGPALKADPTHFQSDVQFVKFDTSGTEAAKKSAAASAMGDKVQQAISILPIFALLIVGFMVVKAISKAAKDQTVLVQALPDGRMIPLSAPLSLGAPGVEGGRDGAGAAGSGGTQEQGSLPALKKAKPEIGEIPDNVNVPLEQIKKMATERPEAVAMLIKSWLLEDRR